MSSPVRPCGRSVSFLASAIAVSLALAAARPVAAAEVPEGYEETRVYVPIVSVVVGRVDVQSKGSTGWAPVAEGTALEPGDVLRTGARSKAEVIHAVGVIRLFQHTVLRVPVEVKGEVHLVRRPELLTGQALFDVVPSRLTSLFSLVSSRILSLSPFEVATPHVVSGVKGTRFAVVERGPYSMVAVYGGIVETSSAAGSPRDTALLTVGKLAEYDNGRLTGVSGFSLQDDWAAWARPAVQSPRAPQSATGGDTSGPTRESHLDGGSLLGSVTATVEVPALSEAAVSSPTATTDSALGTTGTTTDPVTTTTSTTGTTSDPTTTTTTSTSDPTTTTTVPTLSSTLTSGDLAQPIQINPGGQIK